MHNPANIPNSFQRRNGGCPPILKLDRMQQQTWEEARTGMLITAPHCSHIFYSLMNPRQSEHVAYFTDSVPIAATDGVNLFLNPNVALSKDYSLGNRVFMCAHEIFHCIFNHPGLMHTLAKRKWVVYQDGTRLPFYAPVMNYAMDYVINDMLITSGIGVFHKNWLHDTSIATAEDSVIDAYKKLMESGRVKIIKGESQPCEDGEGGEGEEASNDGDITIKVDTGGKKSFDELLEPGTGGGEDPHEAAQKREDAEPEWQTEVAAAMAAAEAQGKLPANLKRIFGLMLEPQVDWKDKIRSLVLRAVGEDEYSWRRLDRRLIVRGIGAPGRIGYTSGVIVIGGDTSGSINAKTLDMFLAEIQGVLEACVPEKLYIAWCDAMIHRVDELDDVDGLDEVRYKGAPGGGGTSFVPVFNWINAQGIEPDALIYLTDGYGSFPEASPDYPVIWGSIACLPEHYPFGEVAMIPQQAE